MIRLSNPLSFYVKSACKFLLALPLMLLSYIFPRSRRHVVAGAWHATLYADNPKYFVQYLLENTCAKVTWIGNPLTERLLPTHPNLSFARYGSLKAALAALRAKTWVYCNSPHSDITPSPLRGSSICVNLWHGIPLKLLGVSSPKNRGCYKDNVLGLLYLRLMRGPHEWVSISSSKMGTILSDGLPSLFTYSKTLPFGTPRNDFLLKEKSNTTLLRQLRVKYANLLGIDPTKKIITYLPTWRRNGVKVFSFYGLPSIDAHHVSEVLTRLGASLIEQHHFQTYMNNTPPRHSVCSSVITFEKKANVDAQELLLITDILISDYSGAYIDFGLLGRPCIHFAYDLDDYKNNDSGLAYDLEDVAAGPIVRTLDELLAKLEELFAKKAFQPAPHYRDLVEYETGQSCEQLAKFMHLK